MTESLPLMFSALADETRWAILSRLGKEPASASTLARDLPVSRQAIAKHLEVLRAVGIVEAEQHGRQVMYRALGNRLNKVAHDLEQIGNAWEQRLTQIKQLAEEPQQL